MNLISNIKDNLRLLYPFRVIVLGLAVAQVVATVLVYLSNRALAGKITAIQAAGYGPIPGVNIDPSLSSLEAAFAGGAFFALSTGAGVAVLTFVAVLLVLPLPALYRAYQSRVLKPGFRGMALAVLFIVSMAAAVPAIGWLIILIQANARGFCPGLTAFLLLVPPPVIWAAVKWSPQRAGYRRLAWRNPFHFVLIAILLAMWSTIVNPDVFINVKDNLLLTSRAGSRIVDFYYRYTLYPAEVFKTPADKQLKTCVIAGNVDPEIFRDMETALRRQGYFVIEGDGPAPELKLVSQQNRLILGQGNRAVLIVDRDRFMKSTAEILDQFSEETDKTAFFRRFTMVSLLGVAPLVLYMTSYAFFCLFPGALVSVRAASWLAPLMCFVFWAGVMPAMDIPAVTEIDRDQAAAAIRAGTRKEGIAALRFIHENRLDIADFPGYRNLLKTPDFAQRYWLVRNLGNSRDPEAASAISRFLASESAYIVCKAIAATADRLENKGEDVRQAGLQSVLDKMRSTDNWYVQFYAFRAAGRLGWIPEKSDL